MLGSWLKRRRRRKHLSAGFPAAWLPTIERLSFYGTLGPDGQQRLRQTTQVLVVEKEYEGCQGVVVDDDMRVTIAAQAALLLLGLEHDYYRNVQTILIYPSSYVTAPRTDAAGVVRAGHANLGEAWSNGPVILSWDSVKRGAQNGEDGRNLVFHEFAHKLDMLDGLADGTPPLDSRRDLSHWVATMSKEFDRLRDAEEHRRATLLDKYGATNPAEFFAVATECFFERGDDLRERHPELFAAMAGYFGTGS
ncbi:MAG: M90 family metallopeptidase [Planctomycetota bacterium]